MSVHLAIIHRTSEHSLPRRTHLGYEGKRRHGTALLLTGVRCVAGSCGAILAGGVHNDGMRGDLITFTETRAAELAGLKMSRVREWAAKGIVTPSAERRIGRRRVIFYDFDAMVELLVAAQIRDFVSLQHMRAVTEMLRRTGHDKPLRQLRFAVAGSDIYFQLPDGSWEGGRKPGQAVIHQVVPLEKIRATVRKNVQPDRTECAGQFERRRGVQGSREVFAGTRIPVASVENYLREGFSDADVIRAYPDLKPADIAAARQAMASA